MARYSIGRHQEIELTPAHDYVSARFKAGTDPAPLLRELLASGELDRTREVLTFQKSHVLLLPVHPDGPVDKVHAALSRAAGFSLGAPAFGRPGGSLLIPEGNVNARLSHLREKHITRLLHKHRASIERKPSPELPFHVLAPREGNAFLLTDSLVEEGIEAHPRFTRILKAPARPSSSFSGPSSPPRGTLPDPSHQWGWYRIRTDEAWKHTRGSPTVKVAVLDCGVDYSHPELKPNLQKGYDMVDADSGAQADVSNPDNYHGTACAGVIAATGPRAFGVAPECQLLPIRLSDIRFRRFGYEHDVLPLAIRKASELGARVINLSLGDPGFHPDVQAAIYDVVHHPDPRKRCVVIAAAGNDLAPVSFPAAYDDVIAVGATDPLDQPWRTEAGGSNFGPEISIAAPGAGIWTADLTGSNGLSLRSSPLGDFMDSFSGTSAACSFAAGVAALMLSINPDLSPSQVRELLEQEAFKRTLSAENTPYLGKGRIDAERAVLAAKRLSGAIV